MKRVFATLLALTMALALFGCAKKPEAQEALSPVVSESDAAAEAPTDAAPAAEEWNYVLTTHSESGECKSDEDVLLATVSYELPVLQLTNASGEVFGGETAERGVTQRQLDACRAFNARMEAYRAELVSAEKLGQEALAQYNEMSEELRKTFPAYMQSCELSGSRQNGDLLDVVLLDYGYWGGAHGGSALVDLHFDLAEGTFFTLRDLSDEPEKLLEEIRRDVLRSIWESGEEDWYFDDYSETVSAKDDFTFTLDETGITVYFSEYEIAPYAAGMPEFLIPYANISRFLNERGQRLLGLSAEDRAMGDYYAAEEMWNWFEGAMPLDYDDTIMIAQQNESGSYDAMYARVDIPGVRCAADMEALLRTRFTAELAHERVAANEAVFLHESDGKLYAMPAGRGDNLLIAGVDYAIRMNDDGEGGVVTATIRWQDYDEAQGNWALTGETTDYEMPFTLTDGGAIFSKFYTIW